MTLYVCDAANMDDESPLYAVLAPEETEFLRVPFQAAVHFKNLLKGRASTSAVHDNPREVAFDEDGCGSIRIVRYIVAKNRKLQMQLDDILDFPEGSVWTEIPADLAVDYDAVSVAEFRRVIRMEGDGTLVLLWRGNIEGKRFETDSIRLQDLNDYLPVS